ncbi:Uncharacterised protein [Staphylococcus aureus]|nr:hypothetical protein O778_01938 [Staphylococcus aureus M0139]EVH05147.1 hypothetical protein T909_01422 [Staphylococcus aureus UCIM6080]KIN26210.1 hypothetical protein AH72_00250 [Staphylococcus aureus MRSA_CVM43477]CAC6186160.1 Uncharacterised protein [Staphylococcus aureus]SGV70601.1 Uncharacterised protein [Staphylococcus aureus]
MKVIIQNIFAMSKFYMKNENYLNKVLRATILRVMIFK